MKNYIFSGMTGMIMSFLFLVFVAHKINIDSIYAIWLLPTLTALGFIAGIIIDEKTGKPVNALKNPIIRVLFAIPLFYFSWLFMRFFINFAIEGSFISYFLPHAILGLIGAIGGMGILLQKKWSLLFALVFFIWFMFDMFSFWGAFS